MKNTNFVDPNVSLQVNGITYYTITLAFETYKSSLKKGIGFSSFYKNFAKWRVKNEIVAETRHIAKFYSKDDILLYINYLNNDEYINGGK